MVPKQQQRQLMNQNKSKTGRRKKKTKKNRKREAARAVCRSQWERQETEAQERWGCLLRAARGEGCLLLEESFILLLGWSGSHRAGSRALGNSWVMLIIAFNQPSPYAGNNWGPQLGTQSRPAPRASGVLGGCY